MVRPYSWDGHGGPGCRYYDIGGALVVNQTADVIREVNDLLESLRRLQDLSVAVEVPHRLAVRVVLRADRRGLRDEREDARRTPASSRP